MQTGEEPKSGGGARMEGSKKREESVTLLPAVPVCLQVQSRLRDHTMQPEMVALFNFGTRFAVEVGSPQLQR